jgi:type IV pilus assembly protein PilA
MQPGPQYPYGGGASPPAKKFPVWIIIVIVIVGLGVVGVGVFATLGIYGTRRYLAAAKTSEAKNSIGAIARGARAAYEYESADPGAPHRLCGSAVTVPAAVPAAVKYMPTPGADFDTGDSKTGWKCLKFSMTQPIYYQYSYHQGSGYLATSTSPGADGFEAAARGDLDGNGKTSLFAMTGKVAGGTVTMSPSMFVENEFE